MRITRKRSGIHEGDLTPMIDMTFQLIAFFMVLINFTEADQDERIKLPSSELAKPPDAPFENPITLQLMKNGDVIVSGRIYTLDSVRSALLVEIQLLTSQKKTPEDATVIIRADAEVETGLVQKLIQNCQELQLIKFALRAKQEEARLVSQAM